MSLMEALTAAVAAGGAVTPVLIHSATYQGGIASVSTGTFSLDDSLAASARFAVYYYDLNHVGNTIHLTSPSGATFASVNMQEEDGDVNMIFVTLHNAEVFDFVNQELNSISTCHLFSRINSSWLQKEEKKS